MKFDNIYQWWKDIISLFTLLHLDVFLYKSTCKNFTTFLICRNIRDRTLLSFQNSMTFHDLSKTFLSFPSPKLSSYSRSSIKTNTYLTYFPALEWIKCLLGSICTEIEACYRLVLFFSSFYLFAFLLSESTFYDFPWPSPKFHDNWNNKFHDFPGFPWPVRTLNIVFSLSLNFKN